jgi:hypothetical protein
MKGRMLLVLAIVGLLAVPAGTCFGSIYAAPPGGGAYYYPGGGTVGTEFEYTSTSTNVLSLGIFDYASDGLAGSHVVTLFDAAQNVVVSATIPGGTAAPLVNGYRWVNVSATIAPGDYVIAAEYHGNGVGDWFQTIATIDPSFTMVQDRYADGGTGLLYPDQTDFNNPAIGWFGPNLYVGTAGGLGVPEPATMIIWSLLGVGGWLGTRVSRRRQGWSDDNRTAIHQLIARGRQ